MVLERGVQPLHMGLADPNARLHREHHVNMNMGPSYASNGPKFTVTSPKLGESSGPGLRKFWN
jgi:hypothetical protein